jgi:hypothetical protein
MTMPIGQRLEQYTIQYPSEVLLVSIEVNGIPDQIAIFKGFSSSIMGATAFDPDVPMIPDGAVIRGVDRLQSPYDPSNPRYIAQNISWSEFEKLL